MSTAWGRLSFSLVLIILAAVTLVGVVTLRFLDVGVDSLLFLLVPIAAGVWYLYENRANPPIDLSRPPPDRPAARAEGGAGAGGASGGDPAGASVVREPGEPMPSPDEPFDDPVELADRLDRQLPPADERAPPPTAAPPPA